MAQPANGFLFNLANSLAGQPKFLANLLKGHFLAADAKKVFNNFAFPLGKGSQGTINLPAKRLVEKQLVGVGRIAVYQHVKKAILFAINKWCIYGNMPSGNPQGIGYFSLGISRSVANSPGVGVRSNCCSNFEKALLILFKDPTWLRGSEQYATALPAPEGLIGESTKRHRR